MMILVDGIYWELEFRTGVLFMVAPANAENALLAAAQNVLKGDQGEPDNKPGEGLAVVEQMDLATLALAAKECRTPGRYSMPREDAIRLAQEIMRLAERRKP